MKIEEGKKIFISYFEMFLGPIQKFIVENFRDN